MKRIAILGAGVAGLAAALALRDAELDVVVFEKSRGLGGRAATRGREGIRYDHGANYFRADTERVRKLVYTDLPAGDLIEIAAPVRPFPIAGQATEAVPPPAPVRLNYRHGISQLAKLLGAASGAIIYNEVRVERLVRLGNRWTLIAEGERVFDGFDAVLLTPPAPQSAVIVEASEMDAALRYALSKGLRKARYEAQLCLVLGYEGVAVDVDWYARVDTERRRPIAWLAMEHAKTGHVPANQHVLLIQMASAWSTLHYLEPFESLLPHVMAQVRQVLPSLSEPDWHDGQRWRFARATTPANTRALAAGQTHGLFFAGDATATPSRVERAMESGMDAADAIRRTLNA